MSRRKSYEEINEKIRMGEAVVLTAEEVAKMASESSPAEIVEKVDVVTTATFGPMCSSGAFINFGHTDPPIRMEEVTLNGVPAYGGVAAVDAYIGATAENPENSEYGGAHVIEELIKGEDVHLIAKAKGTDCYPRREVDTWINKDSINEAFLFNPRNAYQNYPVATNSTEQNKYTYMGILLPRHRNATFCTSGALSPLINDPQMRTIGIGTSIFLCGARGYVAWNGTQFNTSKPLNERGIPLSNAATLAVIGDLKSMSPDFIKAAVFEKYGVSIFIGLGVPIPILDEDIAYRVSVDHSEIGMTIFDYGKPVHPQVATTTYQELLSGTVEIAGRKARTAPISSLPKAREIAELLKSWISRGEFELTAPVAPLPSGTKLNGLEIRGKRS